MRLMFLLDAGESKELVPLKLLYIVHDYTYSLVAYLPIFFEEVGFTKSEIGVLMAVPCLSMVLGPPIWGAIADALRRHKDVHVFCHITSALLLFAIQFVHSFPLMCATVFIAYSQMLPTLSLLDLAAMKLGTSKGGDFGKQRLYGAFGYGIGGAVCGIVASLADIKYCFSMMLGVSCISLFLLVRYIPAGYGHDEAEHERGDEDHIASPKQKGLLRSSARHILSRPDVLVLFGVALLTGVSGGFIDSFLFLNVYDLSSSGGAIVSVFVAVQTFSEIPIFFLSGAMVDRVGTAVCLVAVVVAFLVRAIVYTVMEQPWYVVPVEMLHGITVGLLVASLTTYLYAAAPKGAAGTMIGLLSAFQRGIGAGSASLVGGYVYDEYGARMIWKISALGMAPASLLVVGLFAWLVRRQKPDTLAIDLETQLVDSAVASTTKLDSVPAAS